MGQGDDYRTGCLLVYHDLRKYYKLIATLIAKYYNKLILLEIQIEQKVKQHFSLLKKQKKQFQIFQTEQLKYYVFISLYYVINIKMSQCSMLNVKLSNSQLK